MGVPESSDPGNWAHPLWVPRSYYGAALKIKDSGLWDMGLLSQEGPTPTFADLLLAPNSVFWPVSFRVNLMPCWFESKYIMSLRRRLPEGAVMSLWDDLTNG